MKRCLCFSSTLLLCLFALFPLTLQAAAQEIIPKKDEAKVHDQTHKKARETLIALLAKWKPPKLASYEDFSSLGALKDVYGKMYEELKAEVDLLMPQFQTELLKLFDEQREGSVQNRENRIRHLAVKYSKLELSTERITLWLDMPDLDMLFVYDAEEIPFIDDDRYKDIKDNLAQLMNIPEEYSIKLYANPKNPPSAIFDYDIKLGLQYQPVAAVVGILSLDEEKHIKRVFVFELNKERIELYFPPSAEPANLSILRWNVTKTIQSVSKTLREILEEETEAYIKNNKAKEIQERFKIPEYFKVTIQEMGEKETKGKVVLANPGMAHGSFGYVAAEFVATEKKIQFKMEDDSLSDGVPLIIGEIAYLASGKTIRFLAMQEKEVYLLLWSRDVLERDFYELYVGEPGHLASVEIVDHWKEYRSGPVMIQTRFFLIDWHLGYRHIRIKNRGNDAFVDLEPFRLTPTF